MTEYDDIPDTPEQRALIAEMNAKAEAMNLTVIEDVCRKCGGTMRRGIAMGQTYTAGTPDFPSDKEAVTFSAGGPGVIVDCLKCEDCGWSLT